MADIVVKRVVSAEGFRVELDLSSQVLAVEAPEEKEWANDLRREEAPLLATLAEARTQGFLSAAVLAQKAKVFDDGLYAAVEIAAQEGAGLHTGKTWLLQTLARTLEAAGESAEQARLLVLGASRLGQVAVEGAPAAMEKKLETVVEKFLADEERSKPIGFYTWSEPLARIFRQDRMLQRELDALAASALTTALQADPRARDAYERHLSLISRLTNPFAQQDLRESSQRSAPGGAVCFFPASVAHEAELVKRLYGGRPIPDDFVLADEMIRRIRSRELDLTPRPESGWYDHLTWALEPLVVPERMREAPRLSLSEPYRKLLLELFKGLLTLTRETHSKQLEFPMAGMALPPKEVVIDIAPELAAEPLPAFYLRRALAYRFVRDVLEEGFGAEQLGRLHRLTATGPVAATLAEELVEIEELFVGAHARVSRELGLAPDAAAGPETAASAAVERFTSWASRLQADPDLGQDLRAMVPVFYDVGRRKTKVWAFLGWCQRPITVSFAPPPSASVFDAQGQPAVEGAVRIRWSQLHPQVVYPVTAELYVDEILDRVEFRALCNGSRTRSAILGRLSGSAAGPSLHWGDLLLGRQFPLRSPPLSVETTRAVRCAVCKSESMVEVKERPELGSRDLDLRPAEGLRSTMSAWIQTCAGCGRCAWYLAAQEPAAKTAVASAEYIRQLQDPKYPGLARRFLCRAMLDEARGAHAEASRALVYAAWDCDDHGRHEAAAACRSRAADHFRAAFAARPMSPPGIAHYVDLLRRAGRGAEARHAIAGVPASLKDPTLRDILIFEQALLERGDAASHTLSEARVFEWLSKVGRLEMFAEPDVETLLSALKYWDPAVHRWALLHGGTIAAAAAGGALSEEQAGALLEHVDRAGTARFAAETLADAGLKIVELLVRLERNRSDDVADALISRSAAIARASGAAWIARSQLRNPEPKVRELASKILLAAPSEQVLAGVGPSLPGRPPARPGAAPTPVSLILVDALEKESEADLRATLAESLSRIVALPEFQPAPAELAELKTRIDAVTAAERPPADEARSALSFLEQCQKSLRAKSRE